MDDRVVEYKLACHTVLTCWKAMGSHGCRVEIEASRKPREVTGSHDNGTEIAASGKAKDQEVMGSSAAQNPGQRKPTATGSHGSGAEIEAGGTNS